MEQHSKADSRNSQRILALDMFRGICMAFMILVGNPGSLQIYQQLDHASWNGWTITDLVFPSFLWIAGVSVTLSTKAKQSRNLKRLDIALSSLRRSSLLFVLGIMMYAVPIFDIHTFRIMGVLQRIAICTFLATLLYLYTNTRIQILTTCVILLGYWAALRYVPVPGYGPGNLSIEGNLVHAVDHALLGRHNYSGTQTWDPEGILSTVSSLATVLLGVLAGTLLQRSFSFLKRCWILACTGIILCSMGLLWSRYFPINKKLWTSSFCLWMAGLDFLILACLLWIIDYKKWTFSKSLWQSFGQNALALYFLSEVSSACLWNLPSRDSSFHQMLFETIFAGLTTPKGDSFLFAFCNLLLFTAVAYYFYRKRWILKL